MKYRYNNTGLDSLLKLALVVFVVFLSACATPLQQQDQIESFASPAAITGWSALDSNLPDAVNRSWFDPQASGPYALSWRLAMIDTAQVSIDAQYFLWEEDAVGSLLLDRLIQAANRGVRVRLLVDDSFLPGEDDMMLAVDAHPNLEMRIFNPFQKRSGHMLVRFVKNLNDYARINHRMHNKLLITDGKVAVVGGRNIADEYFGFNKAMNFRDFDLMVAGKIIPDISTSYDSYWNSGWAFPVSQIDRFSYPTIKLAELRAELRANASVLKNWLLPGNLDAHDWSSEWAAVAAGMIPGDAVLLQDDPNLGSSNLPVQAANQIIEQLEQTQSDILSLSAYLVPSVEMIAIADKLTSRGVRIRALTNSLATNNHVAAHSAYRKHRREMLKAGVELHEMRPDAQVRNQFEAEGFAAEHIGLHAKLLVLDKRLLFVGTINADPRSMRLNTEVSLLIDSPKLADVVAKIFSPDFEGENSWQLGFDEGGKINWRSSEGLLKHQPANNTLDRVADFFYGVLPIEDQL
ncbi:MAG: phospholipase D family protein [Xanthomonadales bacterium]|nr:phospholipase D family protein [Xanthomonadales bacterium]